MRRMTKVMAIAILTVTQISNAGWLSSLGQRIVNGAVNTVQSNISNKVNKTIDNAMDGKLAPQQKNSSSQSHVDNYTGQPGLPTTGASAGGPAPIANNQVDSSGMLSLDYVKKRALPVKEIYEEVDFGTFKFRGERIYYSRLSIGEQYKELNFYLLPGTYLVCFTPRSYDHDVSVSGKHEREGIDQGYGINVLKYIQNKGLMEMNAKKGSTVYTIEVSKNGGNFHMFMFNDTSKSGALEFLIYKIPGPNLEIIK